MAELWLLALGLGVMPFAAVALYSVRAVLESKADAVWGFLLGVIAFLGLSHAMSTVLFGDTVLTYGLGPTGAIAVVAAGIVVGLAAGRMFLERGIVRGMDFPSRVAWAAVAFLALHSFSDGLMLGRQYVGPIIFGFDLDAAMFTGTAFHRFAEGAILVVPALAAAWRPGKAFMALSAGLLVVPAAFLPLTVYNTLPLGGAGTLTDAIMVFVAAAEAGFSLFLLFLGFVPRVIHSHTVRWAAWAGMGFLAITLVHGFVE